MNDPFLHPDAEYLRLIDEYHKYGSLCIGFDFDGTIHDYHKEGHAYPAVMRLLRECKEVGLSVVCWTAYPDHTYVEKYLRDNDITFDGINTNGIPLPWETRKPFFSLLLDDRCGLAKTFKDLTDVIYYIKKYLKNKA